MRQNKSWGAASIAALIFSVSAASIGSAAAATIQIGSYTVDEADAANSVTTLSGTTQIFDKFHTGVATEDAAIGGSLLDGVRCVGLDGCSFSVGFGQDIINNSGYDIVIAGLGNVSNGSETFDLEIGGVTLSDFSLIDTGTLLGTAPLKALAIDLSDFGLSIGDALTKLTFIIRAGVNAEEFTYVSLYDDEDVLVNPIPGAAWLFGSALAAGGVFRRKSKKKTT